MNDKLWAKFRKLHSEDCYGCPHGSVRTWKAPRIDRQKFPGLHESFYAPVEHKSYSPKKESGPCLMCLEGWVDEKKAEGKICVKCGIWITKENEGMVIEAEYEDGSKKRTAVCGKCLTGGGSVDEWAKDMVAKAKNRT